MVLGVRSLIAYGIILNYNGLLANIPKGYQICDGTNGTPDLRSKFVKGVLTNATNPGTIGGEDSHVLTTLEIPSHTHSTSETSHTHTVKTNTSGVHSFSNSGIIHDTILNGGFPSTSSSLAGVSVGNTGGGLGHENRPAFYELLYIMKISD